MAKSRTRRRLATGIGIGLTILVTGILPLMLTTLPEPVPVKIDGLNGQRTGVYFETGHGLYKVFPLASKVDELPRIAVSTGPTPRIYVKFRVREDPALYGIYSHPFGDPVALRKTVRSDHVLVMTPQHALEDGEYYAQVARGGMYGGKDYYYFEVSADGRSPK